LADFTRLWAHSVPSGNCVVLGKSAQFTNQLSPSAMVRVADQRALAKRANLSRWPLPLRSIQLRFTAPFAPWLRLGCAAAVPAGSGQGSMAAGVATAESGNSSAARNRIIPPF
jgi:hypothetical protein